MIDPSYPAFIRAYEYATGIPYLAGLVTITDLLFEGGDDDPDQR